MKILLILPIAILASCSNMRIAAISDDGMEVPKGRFDRFANNGRDAENMDHSFALLEQIQRDNSQGQVIFWESGGREYFHVMRQIGPSAHQGPNPSLGYYTSRRKVVNVNKDTIPWARILAIKAKSI